MDQCLAWVRSVLTRAGQQLARICRRIWQQLAPHSPRRIPIIILILDPTERRRLEGAVRNAVRCLPAVLELPAVEVTILVQQVVATDRQLAGCIQTIRRTGGSGLVLLRLALAVNGQVLSTDELLATLAELWIRLTIQHSGWATTLVPLEQTPPPAHATSLTVLAGSQPCVPRAGNGKAGA